MSFHVKERTSVSTNYEFAVFLSLAVFGTNIVNQRWTKEYYNFSLGTRNCPETSPKSVELIVSETEIKPAKIKTQGQRYCSLMKTCQLLASLGSEGGMSAYESLHEQLQTVLEQWQRGQEVVVFANDDFNEPPDDVNPGY